MKNNNSFKNSQLTKVGIPIIRLAICGSVDDGKSTLVGHLMHLKKLIYDDEYSRLKSSKNQATTSLDFSLLTDGLEEEQKQKITIDVATKYLNFKDFKIILSDAPGHEQYTRNMFTAVSNSEIAILLVDVKNGINEQTKRHLNLINLSGIKKCIIAINKMDLVNYKKNVYENIENELKKTIKSNNYKFNLLKFIPISGIDGENLITKSKKMQWYKGRSLFGYLKQLSKNTETNEEEEYVSISNIIKTNNRYYQGIFNGKVLNYNDTYYHFPSHQKITLNEIYYDNKNVKTLKDINPVSLTINEKLDISVGDTFVKDIDSFFSSKLLNINLVNLSENEIYAKKIYYFKFGTKLIRGRIIKVKEVRFSKNQKLIVNSISTVEIELFENILISKNNNSSMNKFIMIDTDSLLTIASGSINFIPRRKDSVVVQNDYLPQQKKELLLSQKGFVIWITGLPSSGKTTISKNLELYLYNKGLVTAVLDGDNIRKGINSDLSFSKSDRSENIRRISEIAKLMVNNGLITIVCTISPYSEDRLFSRGLFKKEEFFEIYTECPLKELINRDVKGLYASQKVDNNIQIPGVNSHYEPPVNPELKIKTNESNIKDSVEKIIKELTVYGFI